MRADRNYKMSKQGNITLANYWNSPMLPEIRKGLINAELSAKQIIRSKKGDK